VNQDALLSWVGSIPENVLQDINGLAPMLQRFGYDTSVRSPDYNKHLDPILERTFNV